MTNEGDPDGDSVDTSGNGRSVDGSADDGSRAGDLFSRSLREHEAARRRPGAEAGAEDADDEASPTLAGDRYRRRLGLSELQWAFLVSLVLALPYPLLFYLFFTARLTSLPLLFVTLLYSLFAIYVNHRL